uniref:NADH-ubiquinone oxidoreductase chain 6 n=1 Tax=Isonychia kiangsinensis TaxID=1470551 RepID=A0A482FF30_9INSE|nr:NADH dehydrogenase subunit 6 [Isonychia kiangsinensis]QBO27434.1 NADH dehydrogenase subunit 6 [Isonychia kiangsinensis]
MQMTLLGTSILIGLLFTLMSHPLAMGLTLLLQTLMIALLSGLTASNFWFSYILFLVFLGGMLVLFIYVTSLASNELFSSSSLLWMLFGLFLMAVVSVSFMADSLLASFPMTDLLRNTVSSEYLSSSLLKLYSSPSFGVTLLLVIYLLLTLVAVVNIAKIFKGPLRPQN